MLNDNNLSLQSKTAVVPAPEQRGNNQHQDFRSKNYWSMGLEDLPEMYKNGEDVERFLQEEYIPFAKDFLKNHGLNTDLISNLDIEYDHQNLLVGQGNAMYLPSIDTIAIGNVFMQDTPQAQSITQVTDDPNVNYDILADEEESKLLTAVAEELGHAVGKQYFEINKNIRRPVRADIEEAVFRPLELYCDDNLHKTEFVEEYLKESENFYNDSSNTQSSSLQPGAGTRIKDTAEELLDYHFRPSKLDKQGMTEILSDLDTIAEHHIDKYFSPNPAEMSYRERKERASTQRADMNMQPVQAQVGNPQEMYQDIQ